MIQVATNTLIYQPIKRVFDFISTPENDFQWQYGTLSSISASDNVTGIGAHFQRIGNFMGQRMKSTYEVTEYEPNQKYSFKCISGPLLSFTSYSFTIAKSCTQVKLSMQATVTNLIEFNENIIEKKMKRQFKDNLTLLKSILETK